MNSNDKIILEQIIEQQHKERAPTSPIQEFFEIFVAEQTLKDHDLGYDELESGLVGGGNDGGIDAMYVLVNGELAQDDFEISSLKKGVLIETVLIQAKLADGFRENAIEKLMAASEELFDLGSGPINFGFTEVNGCDSLMAGGVAMSDLFMLSKKQFNRIKPYFPLSHGVPRVDDLRVISGIIYVIKNGPAMEGRSQRLRPLQDALQSLRALEQDGHIQPHFCRTGWQRGNA